MGGVGEEGHPKKRVARAQAWEGKNGLGLRACPCLWKLGSPGDQRGGVWPGSEGFCKPNQRLDVTVRALGSTGWFSARDLVQFSFSKGLSSGSSSRVKGGAGDYSGECYNIQGEPTVTWPRAAKGQ